MTSVGCQLRVISDQLRVKSVLLLCKRQSNKNPEHRRDEADGEREDSLDRIAEHRGRIRGKAGEPALAPAEYGNQQQENEKQHGRQTVVGQLGNIFVMRCIKVVRQSLAILLRGDLQAVFTDKLIKAGAEGSGTAAGQKVLSGKKQTVVPDGDTVAAKGELRTPVQNFM